MLYYGHKGQNNIGACALAHRPDHPTNQKGKKELITFILKITVYFICIGDQTIAMVEHFKGIDAGEHATELMSKAAY